MLKGVFLNMPTQIYKWKRFWCPREGKINLSDGGYLYDPDSYYGKIMNPNLVSFEAIADVPCLVLLGEPGIGKSIAIDTEKENIDNRIKEKGDQSIRLDLRSYSSEDRLINNIFKSQNFISWLEGNYKLHLFLDSLDECLLRIDTLATLLVDELQKYPIDKLNLRIACRTADWRKMLEDSLKEIWGKESVEIYELVPLRRIDVEEAAKANGLDSDKFLKEIEKKEVVPLAIKPITLNFLINTYRKNQQFPQTQNDLYKEGCLLLCEESNESRRSARLEGNCSAEKRFIMAARIAYITTFSNRFAVWTERDRGDVPEEDVTVQKISGGKECANGEEFLVDNNAIKETLGTGLFSSRGENRMGWAHKTYAEFLASWYIFQKQMTLNQIMSLIAHPNDPDKKLVPQLHETAAWLAGMIPEIFHEVIKTDPEVLLRSDVATTDAKSKELLVENLLTLLEKEKLHDQDLNINDRYRKLFHPNLSAQLRAYLCDRTKGALVRRAAINIAEACELKDLQDEFIKIALDTTEQENIRVEATSAISKIGDEEVKSKLKPLACGVAGEDHEDELKGYALLALWPNHLSAKELFHLLTLPKKKMFLGSYQFFVRQKLLEHLRAEDIPEALKWLDSFPARHKLIEHYHFKKIINDIMLKSWEYLDNPSVLEPFAKAIISRLKHHEEIVEEGGAESPFRNKVIEKHEKRRKVLNAIVSILLDSNDDILLPLYSRTPLILDEDFPWLIECFKETDSEEKQKLWAKLIKRSFNPLKPAHVDAIFVAKRNSNILEEEFEEFFKAVDINSPEAEVMRKSYLKRRRWEEPSQKQTISEHAPYEKIIKYLNDSEQGNVDSWWHINYLFSYDLRGQYYDYSLELKFDITALPLWENFDDFTKKRLINAAKKYILEKELDSFEWVKRNPDNTITFDRPVFAGFRALFLFLKLESVFISSIPENVWKRWAPIVLAFPSGDGSEEDFRKLLVEIAYYNAPDETIKTLMFLIDRENRIYKDIYILSNVENCLDDRLINVLFDKAMDKNLTPKTMGCLLRYLLEHKSEKARNYAESLINLPLPSDKDVQNRSIIAACELIMVCEDAGWTVIWPAFQQNTEFGKSVIYDLADHAARSINNIGERLNEDQIADLYIWLEKQFPRSEDPKHEGGWVGPKERIAQWRYYLLESIKNKGTQKACDAISRIMKEFPELDWLKWMLLDAKYLARQKTWLPPQPEDILKIAQDRNKRLISNGNELLDVVIASLKDLESELHGETPAVNDLWNRDEPKEENDFSDYIKRHFDRDLRSKGIIANREVRIHRGERTDIYVDAIIPKSTESIFETVKVIIEVKGCWNPDLSTAMETQLLNQYLKNNDCQYGLYLVGWFNCENWNREDYRYKQSPKISIDEAQKQFDSQAQELSKGQTLIKALVIDASL